MNNDIYIVQNDIWTATKEGSYMTVETNYDTGRGVDGDILPETNGEAAQDSGEEVEVVRMVNQCFKRYDGLPECANITPINEEMEEEVHGKQEDEDEMANLEPRVLEEDNDDNAESMEDLLKEARTPLFKDSPTNRLQAILMLLNVCNIFGVPNACVDELLKLLKHDLLPKENTCPPSHYERRNW